MEQYKKNLKPLKRHPAFIPLSKDHHFGLMLCWKIRTGLGKSVSPERIAAYVNYFFQDHLNKHFEEEEKYIFTLVGEEDEKRATAEQQHYKLRELVAQSSLNSENLSQILQKLEKDLESHIRFEERDLFPYLQNKVPEPELEKLKQVIEEIHTMEPEVWEDQFWLNM